MKIRGADFFAYLVSDLKKSAAFYREVLGLTQTEYRDDWQWAEFDCGNITLTLYGGSELPEIVLGGRIALAVEDIQAAHRELQEKKRADPARPFRTLRVLAPRDPRSRSQHDYPASEEGWQRGIATSRSQILNP